MTTQNLSLEPGQWLIANCGKYPSERNCKLVFMAPESKREELLSTVAEHAVNYHAHEDTPELKKELNEFLELIEIK